MNKTIWECQNCGSQFPKWTGQCPECQKWNSLVETVVSTKFKVQNSKFKITAQSAKPQKLSDILKYIDASGQRTGTGIEELDRVLGGGLVSGEVVLLAGEPGMGKSTLLSRVALEMVQKTQKTQSTGTSENQKLGKSENNPRYSDSPIFRQSGHPSFPNVPNILYVCGEENPSQVALRLQRLSMATMAENSFNPSNPSNHSDHSDYLSLLPETNVDAVIHHINTIKNNQTLPKRPGLFGKGLALVIVDSIQTLTTDDLTGVAGSVGQVRECAGRLMEVAKKLNVPIFLVGHVTKDGTVAGPKVLEHMVDAVLVLEGERSGNFRILRAVKNRFGAVDEVGLFAMNNGDMKEVANPGELLVGETAGKVSGSVLGCALEGLHPLILEVQALAVPSKLAVPRRVGQGISERKLQVLCAVVERYVNRKLGEMDIFVNIAGGLKSNDPGLDLAAVGAIISSTFQKTQKTQSTGTSENQKLGKSENNLRYSDSPILRQSGSPSIPSVPIFCGEVGLLGEVRQVQGWERREKEVKRLGMGQLVGAGEIKNIRELQRLL